MKRLTLTVLILALVLSLTSCITTKSTSLPKTMVAKTEQDADKEVIGTMSHRFKVHFNIIAQQKPSNETIIERINQMTINKYGESARPTNISFVHQTVDTFDLLELITEAPGFTDTDMYIIANWEVILD